ncbi:MAG: Gfo/Idh/MocA family oxidoreductase, partial [candidate division Zixibacteria bacterium]|nr:Gfo/Idh/MocA family oxidoreductase [candidate division Zixibacteria bacterium]
GELLNTDEKRRVVLGCYQVRFSLNAINNETYDKIHFAGNDKYPCPMHHRTGKNIFDKVIENITKLVKLKIETGAKVKIALGQIIQPYNFHELKNFVEMAHRIGVDSVQIRAESCGMVDDFSEQEKKVILAQVYEIKRKQQFGMYGDMELDLRGVQGEELESSKDEAQFLPGLRKAQLCRAGTLKRGVNPYGRVFHCEFSMHPQNARNYPYYTKKIGDVREKHLTEILKDSAGKYPLSCAYCQAHEYGINIALEKFADDYWWGIDVDDQPYYSKEETKEIAVVGLGRWGGGTVLDVLLRLFPKMTIHGVARSNYNEWLSKNDLHPNIIIHRSDCFESEILQDPKIRVVMITTQFTSHYELVKSALLAGKDVFVEKPFTEDSRDAQELIDIAERNDCLLVIGYEFMFDRNIRILKQAIVSGEIGEIDEIELNMLNPRAGRKLDLSSNVLED